MAGKECVGVVQKVGPNVKSLRVGDKVISGSVTMGAWREEAKASETNFLRVSKDLPNAYAATLHVNPCTAYRMLRDFVALKPGDVIIQNAANSMVGLAVVQMAREMGVKTINVVRSDRPEALETVRLIENLGGDINVLDTFVNTAEFREMIAELPPIRLAFNAVGGDSATELLRVLAPGGHLVTYGGMSKRPMTFPVDLIAQKQLHVDGFWISKWHETHSVDERAAMLEDISQMILNKKLSFFYEMHDFDDFEHALSASYEPFRLRKVVLNMDYPDRFKEHDAKTASDYEHFLAPADV